MKNVNMTVNKSFSLNKNIKNKNNDCDSSTKDSNTLLCYINADNGLLNKREELINIVNTNKPDILHINETLPKSSHNIDTNIEYQLDGYNCFFNENPSRGIAMYIKNDIDVTPIEVLKCDHLESLWQKLTINSKSILAGCVYRSPDTEQREANSAELITLLDSLEFSKYDNVIITGDYNYPKIDWKNTINCTGIENRFVECLQENFLQQHVTKPTRNVFGQKSNLLDLILTNDDSFVTDIEHIAPLGKSDHDVLLVTLNISKNFKKNTKKPKYNFFKTDFDAFKKYISDTEWSRLNDLNCDEQWKFFTNVLYQGYEKYVPMQKSKYKNKPVWLNNKCMRIIKKKYFLYKRYKESELHYDYQKYIEIRNKTKREIRKSVKEYERKISKESKKNVKGFWKYINLKLKRSTGICNLIKPNGDITQSEEEKANVLNDFFSSVFTKEDISHIPTLPNRSNDTFMTDIIVTQQAVMDKLKKLDPNKAMGPDKIPPIILKELYKELSIPLTKIFNKSLNEGYVPSEWKIAEVTAIFKKGSKKLPSNYRPVSLTSIVCKVLESIIKDQIQNYIEVNNLFSPSQHGFRSHRSCVTQLIEVMNDLTSYDENKDDIDIIYMDFSKAFDTVPHQRLLNKLHAYGIDGSLLKWVASFLHNRSQRVRVGESYSDFSTVVSGIPQGSILGPLLFIVFINDLPDNITNSCKIFADDTKVYGPTSNQNSLQKDLLTMMTWSKTWQLNFNIDKCSILHLGKNNEQSNYFLDKDKKNVLKKTTCEKDIGVTFADNLNFDKHIDNVVKKANQVTGLIKRTFSYMDTDMFKKLYKSTIRPHLEYANVIWHPVFKRQLKSLENVQRRATKIVPELKDLPYCDRLKRLDLPSLEYRQIRGDLIQTYKIIHNIDNINRDDIFVMRENTTRNSDLKLYKNFAKSKSRCNFLPYRINNIWNSLHSSTRNSKDLQLFKINIDKELKHLRYVYHD